MRTASKIIPICSAWREDRLVNSANARRLLRRTNRALATQRHGHPPTRVKSVLHVFREMTWTKSDHRTRLQAAIVTALQDELRVAGRMNGRMYKSGPVISLKARLTRHS